MSHANLNDYASRLYERAAQGVLLTPAKVSSGEWQPAANRCHENVAIVCAANREYTPVPGWLYFDFEGLMPYVRFTAHSVIRSTTGALLDITPSMASRRYPFIRAEETDVEFAELVETLNIRHLDYYPKEVRARVISTVL